MAGRRNRGLAAVIAVVAAALGVLAAGFEPSGTSAAESPVSPPVLGRSETVTLLSGSASLRQHGAAVFVPLAGSVTVPDASEVDATRGRVEITVAATSAGQTISAQAYQGRFIIHQDALPPAETHLILSSPLAGCSRSEPSKVGGRRASTTRLRRHRKPSSRHLWVSDQGGSWGTNGHYVSTTVEGTRWLTADSCRASNVSVSEGIVLVHDLIHNKTVALTAGHEYTAAVPAGELPGYVPSRGQVLTGESGGDPFAFAQQVGKHVSVFGYFGTWGGEVGSLISYVRSFRARLLLHLSTDIGYGGGAGQEISPQAIARGKGDGYLVRLCEELSTSTAPVYIALLPEMNQANNAYSAFNPGGSSRGASNSTAAFRQAWRRTVLIVRGGAVATLSRRLHALGMPTLRTTRASLPRPKVSFMWAPQTAGTPDVPANRPAAYYPGSAYVDIVGTDFYSAFPNFAGLSALYNAYAKKPFGFNEWAMWRSGDPGFVRQLFRFVRTHRRIALMVYNEGLSAGGPFRLQKFPAATREIRRQVRSRRFLSYPPER